MIYPIVLYGEAVLKKRAENIEFNDPGVKETARDMYETMYQANGVGLAAPQIGKSVRLFIIDSTPMEDNPENAVRQVFINAEMLEESGKEWAFEEGCLSIPGIREDVMRREKIKIRYYDQDWQLQEKEYEGVVARIIQHEYDHIEGILFTDHLTSFKKRLLKNKLTNVSKGKVNTDYRVKVQTKK